MDMMRNGLSKFQLFAGGTGGIDSWLAKDGDPAIVESLMDLKNNPLTKSSVVSQ